MQDETGSELLQIGDFGREIVPGEQIRIRRSSCLLRKRDMGVEISAAPFLINDGLHSRKAVAGQVALKAGTIPLRLDWFNYWQSFALDVEWAVSNEPPRLIEASNLWHAVVTESGSTSLVSGLTADCYEGSWDILPDFNSLHPVSTHVVTNLDLRSRSRDEGVGIRFSGFLDVPRDGRYRFVLWSDDGSALFLGESKVPVVSLGRNHAPEAKLSKYLEAGLTNLDQRYWTVAEGRVEFVSRAGEGVRFDLRTDQRVVSAELADATGLNLSALVHARVRMTGVGRCVTTLDQTPVFGKLFAASAKDLIFVEYPLGSGDPTLPLITVAQVQSLPIERARQALPVRLRGTVTGAVKTSQQIRMSLQDDTRGIFVSMHTISNSAPACGELWEVEGHSEAGDFAPIVVADKITRLGEGSLPSPVYPTWTELLNGSRDVQWAELKGLVTDVHSNRISLYLPEGRLDVQLEGYYESDLRPFLKADVRIRGVLYAMWDAATREVRVGEVIMRNSTVSVDMPAPADPFDAAERTPRELLLFDAQASAFRPVKVRGQIVYADATQLFLEENGTGLRLLPAAKTLLRPGDLVEVVGYPDVGRTELLLRVMAGCHSAFDTTHPDVGRTELLLRGVLLRKTGQSPLPPPRKLEAFTLSQDAPNSTRVRVEGTLLSWRAEEGDTVLEMKSGERLFLARIAQENSNPLSLRPGSRLALAGVLVVQGRNPFLNDNNKSVTI
jgi:hypothetical protein